VTTAGPAAAAARTDVRELINAIYADFTQSVTELSQLRRAFETGDLERTPAMMLFLADLAPALEQLEGQKLGGKSAEAARFILRAIDRELDRA